MEYKNDVPFIVSLASYNRRIFTLPLCLESLFAQTLKPRKIILYLDDTVDATTLPDSITQYISRGLEIVQVSSELLSHNKYYYTFSRYKDYVIITVDDDVIYNCNTFSNLIETYKRYPYAISATRVLYMTFNSKILNKYEDWISEYDKLNTPSLRLFATGVGGILYPPNILPDLTFDKQQIIEYGLHSDDMWLKFMELLVNAPVVWTGQKPQHPPQIPGTRETGLYMTNRFKNDSYLETLEKRFNINMYEALNSSEGCVDD